MFFLIENFNGYATAHQFDNIESAFKYIKEYASDSLDDRGEVPDMRDNIGATGDIDGWLCGGLLIEGNIIPTSIYYDVAVTRKTE